MHPETRRIDPINIPQTPPSNLTYSWWVFLTSPGHCPCVVSLHGGMFYMVWSPNSWSPAGPLRNSPGSEKDAETRLEPVRSGTGGLDQVMQLDQGKAGEVSPAGERAGLSWPFVIYTVSLYMFISFISYYIYEYHNINVFMDTSRNAQIHPWSPPGIYKSEEMEAETQPVNPAFPWRSAVNLQRP